MHWHRNKLLLLLPLLLGHHDPGGRRLLSHHSEPAVTRLLVNDLRLLLLDVSNRPRLRNGLLRHHNRPGLRLRLERILRLGLGHGLRLGHGLGLRLGHGLGLRLSLRPEPYGSDGSQQLPEICLHPGGW